MGGIGVGEVGEGVDDASTNGDVFEERSAYLELNTFKPEEGVVGGMEVLDAHIVERYSRRSLSIGIVERREEGNRVVEIADACFEERGLAVAPTLDAICHYHILVSADSTRIPSLGLAQ